jgi:hypothetical protein
MEHLHIPPAHRPSWLKGLRSPASKDEALAFAEEHGAPPEALEFLESLPAAVFTSEDGLRHAFSTLDRAHLPERGEGGETPESEDGTDN